MDRQRASAARPAGERWKLALAVLGLGAAAVAGLLVMGLLAPFLGWLYNLWGLLGLLAFFAGLLGMFVAFLVFLLRGKRAAPNAEAPATIESLETKQS